MSVTESFAQGRRQFVERPGVILVGLAGGIILIDLLFKLAGVELGILGGQLAVDRFTGLVWNGIAQGLVFGLAGVGLSLTYSILTFANFSHGDLVTIGGFSGWGVTYLLVGSGGLTLGELVLLRPAGGSSPIATNVASTPLAVVVGLIVSALFSAGVALAIDRIVYKPMRDRDGIILLITSIGVALALRYVIQFVYGARTRRVPSAISQESAAASVSGFTLVTGEGDLNLLVASPDLHATTLIVTALLLMVGLHLMLQRTKLGTAMRAMADNKDLALITGIPTERVVTTTWLLGGGLAGAAGFLAVLFRATISFNFGWLLLLLIFAAVILGGIGSIYGAVTGGLVIGLVLTLSTVWIPSDFTRPAAFLVMILVLLFRPRGLFGGVSTA